jgi:hypothetical protein
MDKNLHLDFIYMDVFLFLQTQIAISRWMVPCLVKQIHVHEDANSHIGNQMLVRDCIWLSGDGVLWCDPYQSPKPRSPLLGLSNLASHVYSTSSTNLAQAQD